MRKTFWEYVDRRGEYQCWPWTGPSSGKGYGRWHGSGVGVPAHRVAWESVNGPIPEGLVIDHLCRNKPCCNPKHLEPVTDRENILRGVGPTAVNAKKTHCQNGHEFTAENTIAHPLGRNCRECRLAQRRAINRRVREAGLCVQCRRTSETYKCEDCMAYARRGYHARKARSLSFGVISDGF